MTRKNLSQNLEILRGLKSMSIKTFQVLKTLKVRKLRLKTKNIWLNS